MYSFLIVAFSGIGLALLAQASSLDFILFMNLVDFSIAFVMKCAYVQKVVYSNQMIASCYCLYREMIIR
jgi:hypothetical protein